MTCPMRKGTEAELKSKIASQFLGGDYSCVVEGEIQRKGKFRGRGEWFEEY